MLRAELVKLKLNLPLVSNVNAIMMTPIPPWESFVPKVNASLIITAKNTSPDNNSRSIFQITINERY